MSSCNFNNNPISNQQKGTLQDADTKNAGDVWAAITGTSNTESPGVSADDSAYLDISASLGFPPINVGGQTAFDTLQSSGIARKLAHFDLLRELSEAERLAETVFTTDANAVTYTPEQKKAIEKAVNYAKNAFSRGNNKAFLLEGSAGTGKTTIIGGIVEELSTTYGVELGIVAGAVSSQATSTLFRKIRKKVKKGALLKSSTVFSMQGSGNQSEKGKFQVDVNNSVLYKDNIKEKENILIIVDEASMINNEILRNFQTIINNLNEKGRKVAIIYSGDVAQVRPVKGGIKSLLFYENNDFIEDGASLTKIIRQSGDSPILDVAVPLSKISKEESNEPMHKILPYEAKISTQGNLIPMGKLSDSILDAFKKGLDMNNPFYIKVVAYTNAAVNATNSTIANHFFKLQERNLLYAKNMPMLANKNITTADGKYYIENNEPFIINVDIPNKEIEELKQDPQTKGLVAEEQMFKSEELRNISQLAYLLENRGLVNQPQDLINKLNITLNLVRVPITKYDTDGKEINSELYIITRGEEVKFRNAITEYYNLLSVAAKNHLSRSQHWAIYYSKFNKIGNIEEKTGVQSKDSEPPGMAPFFAITTHKAQGATYDISVVLVDNIMSSGSNNEIVKAELLYTAITRAANTVVLIDKNIPSYDDNNDINIVEITDNTIENRKSGVAKGVSDLLNKQAEEAKVVEESIIDNTSISTIEESLPGPETTINIYAGTGENADLSNFAERPFDFREGHEDESSEAYYYFMALHPFLPLEFNSVEQAFQAFKWAFALSNTDFRTNYTAEDLDETSESYKRGEKINEILNKIIESNNSTDIKRWGGTRGILSKEDMEYWDKHSSEIMKFLIKQSFKQNPQALQRLLDTGNATLTHNQGTGKWRTEFPKLLEAVRDELRDFQSSNLKKISNAVQKHKGNWSRQEAENNPDILYVFTDNTDRDSGSGIINDDSWYSRKYGKGKHYPGATAAVVRGLDNARPISTQRWYHQGAKGTTGRWTDNDIVEFTNVIKDELEEITKEFNTGKYKTIMFPDGDGLFNTKISNITKERTPKLYQALSDLLHEYGFDSMIPTAVTSTKQQSTDINTISNNTASYGVIIDPKLKQHTEQFHNKHPKGIIAYRVNFNTYNTAEEVSKGHIGNPFSEDTKGEDTVQKFYNWLVTGNNFNNTKATEEFRQAIIQRILNTPQNTPILYYTELNRPSHATVIGYLINNKQLLSNTTSTPQVNNALSKGISLRKPISASVAIQARKKAIQNTSKDDVTQTIKDLKQGKSLNEFLGTTKKPFFSKEEIESINSAVGRKYGKNKNGLYIASLDRQTDGVLFAKEVIRKLEENAKLPIGHPDRIYAMEIWSKHDGKAMFDILDACKKYRVAPMVSFSITSLGGTPFEDGVKDWRDLMKDIEELVKSGVIDTATTTIRLDPFMPGITDMNEFDSIIKESKKLGITRFVSSILNSYANNPERKVMSNIDEAYKKYTGTKEGFPWRDYYDTGKYLPKEEVLEEYFSIIKELQDNNDVTIKICANGVEGKMKGLSPAACLDPYIIEEISGVGIVDSEGKYPKDTARPYEHCYGNRGNLLGNKYPCYSRCAFCYAAQGDNDSVLSYYKSNGELNTEDPRVQYLSKIEKLNNKMDRILKNSEIYVEDFLPENVKARFDKEGINYKGKKVESSDTLINIQKGIDVMDAILNHDGFKNNEVLKKFGSTALQYIKGIITDNSKYIQEFNNTFESVDFNESTYNAFTSLKALVQNKNTRNAIKNIKLIEQENGKLASLVMDFNSEDLETAITVVAESFKTRVNSTIKKEIKAITNEIASSNSELEKAKLRKTLKELQSKETRIKAVINRVGVQGILDEVLSHCKGLQANNSSSQESKDFYGKIIEHFDTLTQEAFPKIETLLNIRLVEESIDNSKESDKERPEDNEDYNEDDLLETNNSVTFKARERDSFKHASNSTKELLGSINVLNSKGKFVFYDNTEIPKKYNGVSLFIDLENEFSHSVVYPSDFAIYDENTGLYSFPLLDKIESKYPWVSELKNKLIKKDMHDAIASMYGDLRKDKIEYVTFKKNKLTREVRKIDLNKPNAVNALIAEIENNIKSDKTEIFNNEGKLSKNSIETLNEYRKLSSSLPLSEALHDDFIGFLQKGLKEIFGLEVQVSKENYSSIAKPFQNIARTIAEKANGEITSIEDLYKNIDINKDLKKLADFISTDTQVSSDVSFYSNGKTYQSFREPCEIIQNIKEIKYHREKFCNKFKGDSFYYNSGTEKFRSYLLNKISTDTTFEIEYQEMFEFDETSYDKWTPFDIKEILFRQYFSTGTYNAWYRMPIHSDSDFMSFLKLPKLNAYNSSTGVSDTYMDAMVDLVKQELARMTRIQKRGEELKKGVNSKIEDIAYYDKRGTDFLFIPELNKFKDDIINARDTNDLNSIIKTRLKTIFKSKLEAGYNQLKNDKVLYETFTSILKENNINTTTETSKIEAFYNYQLNNMLMQSQIIQTFYGDLAFYKNDIEFQKRAKQLIAATRKPFTERPDVKKVDRVIILKDSIVTSRHFNTISKILGNKNKQFTRNNATDAQAFRTLPSYVNIMKGFGFWDSKVDDAVVQRIIEGGVSLEDMNTIYQTIKPFVYGLINKKDVNGEILVPHQHKDSEMVLLAMYEHLDSALNSGSVLRGLNRAMINNNIDVAIFETGVKEGIQGVIDISYSPDRLKELNEKLGKQFINAKELKEYLDKELLADRISQKDYNSYFEYIEPTENEVYNALDNAINSVASDQIVHEIPLEHYGKIQDNPEHLLDTTAIWGTQFNVLSVSDMPQEDFSIALNDGTTKKEYSTKEILNLYNSLRNEKFIEGWNVAKEVFENKQTLQKKLIQLLKTNSNYDYKLKDALELKSTDRLGNIETMDFNTSMNMPNMIDSFSSMMLSVFKKNVVRHEVKGGTATLASSWGFFDKSNSEYKAPEIVFDNNGNLEAVECYLTASSKDFFESFLEEKKDNNGNSYYVLSVDEMPEDLKMCVGYRIPTENKYSMLPLRIKGFIPVQNGTSIIVPPEITTIAGIDFDIDKTFIVLPMYEKKNEYDWKAINRDFREKYPELVKAKNDEIYDFLWKNYVRELKEAKINTKEVRKNDKERFASYVKKAKELYSREDLEKAGVTEETFKKYTDAYSAFLFENKKSYKTKTTLTRVKYDLTKDPSEMTDAERHNLTLDIINKVITHPKMQKVFFSPGNSDSISRAGKVISILGNKEVLENLKKNKSIDEIIKFLKTAKDEELDEYLKENGVDPLSDETFIKFHQQNMMGATLIGPYAISSVGHAKLVYASIMLAEAERFSIDGHEIAKLDPREDLNGRLVSANLAEFISAAVDNAKDPKLAKMLQNPSTANIAEAACRLGIPIDILSYALAHPLVQKIFNESGSLQSLSSYLEGDNSDSMDISTYSSDEFLLAGVKYNESNNGSVDFLTAKTLHFLVRLQKYGDELTSITLNTRQENQNGGLASTLPEALLQVVKVRQMKNNIEYFTNIDSLLKENLISPTASNNEIRESLEDKVLSQTQAGYSLGIENALKEISKFTELASDEMITLLQEVCKNSGKYIVNKKIATSLIYDRIMFNIANSKELFPDTSYGDMYNYYLKEFPKYFINKIKTNSKFNSKKLIKLINLQKGELVCSINNKNKDLTNQLTRELDMLLYGDAESVELAKHLLMYSLFKDGLRFGPTSFAKRFSTNFLKKFSGLDSAVRQLDIKNSFKNKGFLGLFYTNHFHEYGILPEEEVSFSPAPNSTFEVTGDPTPFRVAINSKTYEVYLLELVNTEKNISTYRYTGLSRNRYEKVYPYYSLNKKDVYSINERDSLEDSVRESSISKIRKLYKESDKVVTSEEESLKTDIQDGEINSEEKMC